MPRAGHGVSRPVRWGSQHAQMPAEYEPVLDAATARAGCSLEALLADLLDEADGYRGWQPSGEQVEDLQERLREAWNAWRRDTLHRAA
jgi:hypothetical protein